MRAILCALLLLSGGDAMADSISLTGPLHVRPGQDVTYTATINVDTPGVWGGLLSIQGLRDDFPFWVNLTADYNDAVGIDSKLISPVSHPVGWTPTVGVHEFTFVLQFQGDENIRVFENANVSQLDVSLIRRAATAPLESRSKVAAVTR